MLTNPILKVGKMRNIDGGKYKVKITTFKINKHYACSNINSFQLITRKPG